MSNCQSAGNTAQSQPERAHASRKAPDLKFKMEEHNSVIMPTIKKGSVVLITGVTGFIASHTANQFLEAGYRVRGTVRDLQKAQWMFELFDHKYGKDKFQAVVISDIMADGAFDEAVQGVDGIVHMASITTFSEKPDEVITPAVKGALNILTSATKEAKLKSLVLTSSSAAALMPHPDKQVTVTEDSWDDEAVDTTNNTSDPDGFTVYAASKVEAEKAVWEAVHAAKPPFQVCTVLPSTNFGPIIKPGGEDEASTASMVVGLYNGDNSVFNKIPSQYFVDVRDTARLHVIALIDPKANGQRLFAFAEPYNWNDVLAILRKQKPEKSFPEDGDGLGRDLSKVPNEFAQGLLKKHYGKGWTRLEESVVANIATLN